MLGRMGVCGGGVGTCGVASAFVGGDVRVDGNAYAGVDAPIGDDARKQSSEAPSEARCVGVRSSACGYASAHAARSSRKELKLPGAFQMLYESRDRRLCLFETREGHLAAVDASKLA